MTIKEAYIRYVDLVNRNATNNNLSVDLARFILSFNSSTIRYVERVLNKRNEDEIRNISILLNTEHPLTYSATEENFERFTLPKDYFSLANVHVYAKKGKCVSQRLQTTEAKSENIEELIFDESNCPSFDYRETFYTLSKNDVVVYKKDFDITSVTLTYYRYPKKVDMAGYINIDGKNSKDINPELDDKVVLSILNAMAKDFSASNGDINQYQIDKDKYVSNI